MANENNKTLFVGGLSYNATNKSLENVFSSIGPLKQCFVVKGPGTRTCRGFGFVQFALREDAERARTEITKMDDRDIQIKFADKKKTLKERRQSDISKTRSMSDTKDDGGDNTSVKKKGPSKKNRVIVRNLSFKADEEHIRATFKDMGDMEISIPSHPDGKPKGFAFITFNKYNAAIKATKMSGTKIRGRQVVLDFAVPKDRFQNLESPTKEADSSTTKRHKNPQKAEETDVPATKKSKRKAENKLNNSDKTSPIAKKKAKKAKSKTIKSTKTVDSDDGSDSSEDESDMDTNENNTMEFDSDRAYDTSDGSDDELTNIKAAMSTQKTTSNGTNIDSDKKTNRSNKKVNPSENSSDEAEIEPVVNSENESSEEEEIESESSEEEESENENSEEDESESENSEDDENEGEDSENSGDEDEGESDEDAEMIFYDSDGNEIDNKGKKKSKSKKLPSDVDEGKTLFVRNLAYEAVNEDLQTVFAKFGPLDFARVVFDPMTEHSRGTAFVKFKNKDDAEKCLGGAANKQPLSLFGRQLNVSIAVDKKQAEKLRVEKKEAKEDKDKDSRNLWLAREGMIRPGTQAADGLSKIDLDKRMKLESVKRAKLKDPNIFVSTTRMVVHNLPTSVDDKALRELLLKAVNEPRAKITECRIMRDLENLNSQGVGKSRGYAFVNFTEHAHALKALNGVNNNAELFGEKKRPIVEFSLENRVTLALKEKRKERGQLKQTVLQSDNKKGTFTGLKKKKKEKKSSDDPTIAKPPQNVPKGMKALPTHWGPKIRHKGNTGPDKERIKKRKEKRMLHTEPAEKKAKVQKGQKKKDQADNFDKLVNKYKQKLSSDKDGSPKKSKWFS